MSAPSRKRMSEVTRKRSGPCVICGSLDGRATQVMVGPRMPAYTENNVLPFCVGCVEQMRTPQSPALDRLRILVHNDDALYRLIGDDVDWLYENGRRYQ